jgi:hypothetical protein
LRKFKHISLIILAILIWTAFIGYGFIDGFLLRPITSKNTSEAFIEAAKEKIDDEFVGSFAMTLIENGEISKDFFYYKEQPVNDNTVFPVFRQQMGYIFWSFKISLARVIGFG